MRINVTKSIEIFIFLIVCLCTTFPTKYILTFMSNQCIIVIALNGNERSVFLKALLTLAVPLSFFEDAMAVFK